jgi:hypothetical protein
VDWAVAVEEAFDNRDPGEIRRLWPKVLDRVAALRNVAERFRLVRVAVEGFGYFKADEIGDDLAPRVIEYVSHLRGQLDSLTALVTTANQQAVKAFRARDVAEAARDAALRERDDAVGLLREVDCFAQVRGRNWSEIKADIRAFLARLATKGAQKVAP